MQFTDIKGQENAISLLKCALKNHHVAHAYIFYGPDGVGKKQTALALAQYLNCQEQNEETQSSCDRCPSCIQAKSNSHPDIILLTPDGASIRIEQIRKLLARVALRSYESLYKVVIIDDAHLMTQESANCLLKTLEEPTDNTVFILIASQIQKLPITILSRCQQVRFSPLSAPLVQEILSSLYPQWQSRIGLASILAQGSLDKATDLLTNEELSQARGDFYQFLLTLRDKHPSDIINWCAQWDKNKKMVQLILELLQFWYRDLLLINSSVPVSLCINQDYIADLQKQQTDPSQLLNILQYIQNAIVQLGSNASPKLVLEIVLLKTQSELCR